MTCELVNDSNKELSLRQVDVEEKLVLQELGERILEMPMKHLPQWINSYMLKLKILSLLWKFIINHSNFQKLKVDFFVLLVNLITFFKGYHMVFISNREVDAFGHLHIQGLISKSWNYKQNVHFGNSLILSALTISVLNSKGHTYSNTGYIQVFRAKMYLIIKLCPKVQATKCSFSSTEDSFWQIVYMHQISMFLEMQVSI